MRQRINKFDDTLPNGRYLTSLTKADFETYCLSSGYHYCNYEYNYSGHLKWFKRTLAMCALNTAGLKIRDCLGSKYRDGIQKHVLGIMG